MKRIILSLLAAAVLGCTVLCGCGAETYRVDYGGAQALYEGAQETYAAGEAVEIAFPYIATDTDYRFTMDDVPLEITYEEERGYVIRFTMPAQDVTLRCETKNSMEYAP